MEPMRALRSSLILTLSLSALVACAFFFHRSMSPSHDHLMEPIREYLRSTNIMTLRGVNDQIIEAVDGQFYYQSTPAFIAANPNCCEFMTKDRQNISIPIWARISGKVVSWIKVSYIPTDQAGKPIIGAKLKVRWLQVSHDGKIDRRLL